MRYSMNVPPIGGGFPDNVGFPPDALRSMLSSVDIIGGGSPFGRAWFVNGNGSGNGIGTRDNPFLTMAAALAVVQSGDSIYFKGNVIENLTAPAGIFDVSIIGAGTRPRHADLHTVNNGYSAATWKALSQTDPLFVLRQQGWTLWNILFDCPTSDAALEFIRDAASGNSERDSSHAGVYGCRFAAGQEAIRITGTENVFDVEVAGNIFNDLTHAIVSSGGFANRWLIHNNEFHANTNHIDVGFVETSIRNNIFGKKTTKGIDLTGGSDNIVTMNYLYGTYSNAGGYTAGTNDEWGANMNVISGGWTAADPA